MRAAAIDLGKTRCRFVVSDAAAPVRRDGPGAPGLAAPGGVDAALEAIVPLLDAAAHAIDVLGVGAAGAWAAPEAARQFAGELAVRTSARVAVASDVVTAHAGALVGSPGVLLIAGTGAAALGVDARGVRLVDGWGPELGDLGSGSWLGREGIRAVLRAGAGLGPATALSAALDAHIAPSPDVHAWLAGGGPAARHLATFAPVVLDAAADGDDAAAGIAAEAVRLLTASAAAAAGADSRVALHGGLTDHVWFRTALETALVSASRTVVPARGDALDGALLLAARTDLPHERYVHRAG
ncbi:BadF/BadG/BcrA/BcrD ATPase family protein [Microbacterium sp. CIAB417]|uniref:BadF/BadG/BcrA/BcrD ATPase family protein n=1 Tax=Microbacterium sp. CIAB417 TaxID=2860287 RepID=UPI001FAC0143|nr:BadF/BadG/BcrA/BcrD ATPase family protein [Microbacterium sp. CIAB417]